ncbi:MAG: glutamate racemase [Cyanothece sp. SIO2G6]|nr:glutamate racemase [Cyanothece sp. SIO2G6]
MSRQANCFNPVGGEAGNNDLATAPIGVFDSGVGGLTVLRQLQQDLPHESIVYFGDTANLPYGTKTPDQILYLVRAILQWMISHPVKMVVMACNTSSAIALEIVRSELDIPVLGVILPAARLAVQQGKRIGVLATPATVRSHAYRRAIWEIDPKLAVWEVECPEFVPLIESGQIHSPKTRAIVRRYLQSLIEQQIDTLVYGCTHYPYLSPVVTSLLPSSVRVIDPAVSVSKAVAQELALLGHKVDMITNPKTDHRFYVSDRPQQFSRLATKLLGYRVSANQITLDKTTQLCSPSPQNLSLAMAKPVLNAEPKPGENR